MAGSAGVGGFMAAANKHPAACVGGDELQNKFRRTPEAAEENAMMQAAWPWMGSLGMFEARSLEEEMPDFENRALPRGRTGNGRFDSRRGIDRKVTYLGADRYMVSSDPDS
jgi:hypothetical protein